YGVVVIELHDPKRERAVAREDTFVVSGATRPPLRTAKAWRYRRYIWRITSENGDARTSIEDIGLKFLRNYYPRYSRRATAWSAIACRALYGDRQLRLCWRPRDDIS